VNYPLIMLIVSLHVVTLIILMLPSSKESGGRVCVCVCVCVCVSIHFLSFRLPLTLCSPISHIQSIPEQPFCVLNGFVYYFNNIISVPLRVKCEILIKYLIYLFIIHIYGYHRHRLTSIVSTVY